MAETELTREEVRHVAGLAMLEFSDQELDYFKEQLDDIMNLIDVLNEVDTTDVPATFTVTENRNILRADEGINAEQKDELLARAPESENGLIKVPAIINESAGAK
ncbi:Asp-tRNA(Asn)/Glu-tRNA(Gln) amidotransferase subunit GatC [Periweissella fabalis]|uniref:Aspartyl/glutamyl-tRNA(Asn/Gln) amidotransferase subunit C n=1 Tax=Periweissella fabalis TaxID=1070421 RepID=A0A7X6N4K8_9LACO|nr:Asp-tRNA(Asn)/Glu-tRNA(Gln) amidotransferase subunit GatC [Periweissella fabalis]MCM0598862.1 Asp-tRNA(Asn)/Glu-tRNA(Gln) amidotransferase subunit GatC [Periweissella fabalis]NKZ24524.1 Asp-tRNA(Asn)/Glu-tRNA(Gln) amidotransferase subunit GatC [Periweissella fabalis]